MFKAVTDEGMGCSVWYCGPGETTKTQWDAAYEVVRQGAIWNGEHGVRLAVMMIIDPAFPMPTAEQRTRLRTGVHQPSFDPFIAFVHDNAFLRGFLTTLNWARPHKRSETAFFQNMTEGQAWLEERRGLKFPRLVDMCVEAGASLQRYRR